MKDQRDGVEWGRATQKPMSPKIARTTPGAVRWQLGSRINGTWARSSRSTASSRFPRSAMYEAGVGGGLDEGSKAGGGIGLRSGRPSLRAVGTLLAQPVRIIGTASARSAVAELFRRSNLVR